MAKVLNYVFIILLSFPLNIWSVDGVKNGTPVLLWGSRSATMPMTKPALSTIEQNDFGNIMKSLLKRQAVLVFLEANLTTRDFLFYNPAGNLCHNYLMHALPRIYYVSVANPIEALRSKAARITVITDDPDSVIDDGNPCEVGRVTIVNLTSSTGEDFQNLLTRHDTFIAKTCQKIDESCPMSFLYTGIGGNIKAVDRRSPQRVTRANNVPSSIFLRDPLFAIYCKKLILKNSDGEHDIEMGSINMQSENFELNVTLGDVVLRLIQSGDYYILQEIRLSKYDIIFNPKDVYTPNMMSYFCGKLVVTSGINTLTWYQLQFQGGSKPQKNATSFHFNDPWHCVGYFTPAIMCGIFTMGLMIVICLTGIICLIDIGTNDRMENPDKKPIRINVEL